MILPGYDLDKAAQATAFFALKAGGSINVLKLSNLLYIAEDTQFRQALFQEAVQTLIEGDGDTAKTVLRDYIDATVGFPALAEATGVPPKSLMRMFGPQAEPVRRDCIVAGENRRPA